MLLNISLRLPDALVFEVVGSAKEDAVMSTVAAAARNSFFLKAENLLLLIKLVFGFIKKIFLLINVVQFRLI